MIKRIITLGLSAALLVSCESTPSAAVGLAKSEPSPNILVQALSISQGAFNNPKPRGWRMRQFLTALIMPATGMGAAGLGGLFSVSPTPNLPLVTDTMVHFRKGLEAAEEKLNVTFVEDTERIVNAISPLVGENKNQQLQLALLGNLLTELSLDFSESSLYRSGIWNGFNQYYRLNWGSLWGPARAHIQLRLDSQKPLVRFEFELKINDQWVRVGFVRMGSDGLRDAQHALPHMDASTDDQRSWLAHLLLQSPTESLTTAANIFFSDLQRFDHRIKQVPRNIFRNTTIKSPAEADKTKSAMTPTEVQTISEFEDIPFNASRILQFRQGLNALLSLGKNALGDRALKATLQHAAWDGKNVQQHLGKIVPPAKLKEFSTLLAKIRQGALEDATRPEVAAPAPQVYFYPNVFRGDGALAEMRRAIREFRDRVSGKSMVLIVAENLDTSEKELERFHLSEKDFDDPDYQLLFRDIYQKELQERDRQVQIRRTTHLFRLLEQMRTKADFAPKGSAVEMYWRVEMELTTRGVPYVYLLPPYDAWLKSFQRHSKAEELFRDNSLDRIEITRRGTILNIQIRRQINRSLVRAIQQQVQPYLSKGTSVLIWVCMRQFPISLFPDDFKPTPLLLTDGLGMTAPSEPYEEAIEDLNDDTELRQEMTVLMLTVRALESVLMIGSDAEIQDKIKRLINLFKIEELHLLFKREDFNWNWAQDGERLIPKVIGRLLLPFVESSQDRDAVANAVEEKLNGREEWKSELWTMIASSRTEEPLDALGKRLLRALFVGASLIAEPLFGDDERRWFNPIHLIDLKSAA